MADNDVSPNPSAPSESNASASDPGNITIRIVTLAYDNSREADLYLVISSNTTIGHLKDRLQQDLSRHPRPELQRLICFGIPLLDNNATLRQALRLDQPSANHTGSPYVLHVVIREDPNASRPNATEDGHNRQAAPAATVVDRGQAPTLPGTPSLPSEDALDAFRARMAANDTEVRNQISNLEQIQQRLRMNNPQLFSTQPGGQSPQARNIVNHPTGLSTPPPMNLPTAGVPTPTAAHPSNIHDQHAHHARHQAHMIHHAAVHAASHAAQQAQQAVQAAQAGGVTGSPMVGPQPTQTRVHETVGPNGERIRTVVSGTINRQVAGRMMPNPLDRPASAPSTAPAAALVPGQMTAMQPHPIFPSPFGRFPAHPVPTSLPANLVHPSADQTMAWLASSPSGPQALVFAPGHGFFSPNQQNSTQLQTQTALMSNGSSVSNPRLVPHIQTQSTQAVAQPAIEPPRAQVVVGQQEQPAALQPRQGGEVQQPPVQVQVQRRENEDNDLLNFIIQRGWLFLRLYMFIFVLSEAGTWRRIIMLSIAMVVTVLPRNNPFTEGFMAARRHVENLIGPPQVAAGQGIGDGQQPGPAAVNDANTQQIQTGRPAGQGQTSMPTPEENARRLLRQHQERNPSVVREFLYRTEQAVALFLASLVPGVGERHVRAREEARRIVDEGRRHQEEEQRRLAAEGAQAPDQNASIPTGSGKEQDAAVELEQPRDATVAGSSTGVQAPGTSGEIRLRGGESTGPTASGNT